MEGQRAAKERLEYVTRRTTFVLRKTRAVGRPWPLLSSRDTAGPFIGGYWWTIGEWG